MKNKTTKLLTVFFLSLQIACGSDVEEKRLCETYPGAIVFDAFDIAYSHEGKPAHYVLNFKGECLHVEVYPIDDCYKIGDTIKPCK